MPMKGAHNYKFPLNTPPPLQSILSKSQIKSFTIRLSQSNSITTSVLQTQQAPAIMMLKSHQSTYSYTVSHYKHRNTHHKTTQAPLEASCTDGELPQGLSPTLLS